MKRRDFLRFIGVAAGTAVGTAAGVFAGLRVARSESFYVGGSYEAYFTTVWHVKRADGVEFVIPNGVRRFQVNGQTFDVKGGDRIWLSLDEHS